jgi:ketosteroid isomerase-like protein
MLTSRVVLSQDPYEGRNVRLDGAQATAFVDGYGRTWESWDLGGFVELFSDDVVYVEHPTDETVVGRAEMERYIRKEQAEQGAASVRMGKPIVQGDQVVAEFWATMSNREDEAVGTLMGCFIAQLDPTNGLCTHFRQYWFEVEGHRNPFNGWGQ